MGLPDKGPMSDPRPPAVSVIVAVHDVAGQVAEAIASLRAQTLADFEALVIDDGSTDGSDRVATAAFAGDASASLPLIPGTILTLQTTTEALLNPLDENRPRRILWPFLPGRPGAAQAAEPAPG